MDWFYAQDREQKGPVSEVELHRLAASGVVSPETLVWHPDLTEWKPYAAVAPAAAAVIPSQAARTAATSYRIAGTDCWTLTELAAGFMSNWDEAVKRISRQIPRSDPKKVQVRGDIERWLIEDLHDEDAYHRFLDVLGEVTSGDPAAVLSLWLPALDPSLPPTVDGTPLTRERLQELVAAALQNPKSESLACSRPHLERLAQLTKAEWLTEVCEAWRATVAAAGEFDASLPGAARGGESPTGPVGQLRLLALIIDMTSWNETPDDLVKLSMNDEVRACPGVERLLAGVESRDLAALWVFHERKSLIQSAGRSSLAAQAEAARVALEKDRIERRRSVIGKITGRALIAVLILAIGSYLVFGLPYGAIVLTVGFAAATSLAIVFSMNRDQVMSMGGAIGYAVWFLILPGAIVGAFTFHFAQIRLPWKPIVVSPDLPANYDNIVEALNAATKGEKIRVYPGAYHERVVIDHDVDITGAGTVEIYSTDSTSIRVTGGTSRLRGVTISNKGDPNAGLSAIEVEAGQITLENDDISSQSGSAVGGRGEGTLATLIGCSIHDSKFAGVFVRDHAQAVIRDSDIRDNLARGVTAEGATVQISGGSVHGNQGGDVCRREASGRPCAP